MSVHMNMHKARAQPIQPVADANKSDPSQPTQSSPPKLSCDQCRRTFNRPSHLDRHRRTHLPPSQRRIISCNYCDRGFSRHDVLLRHLRAAHNIHIDTKGNQQRSCHRCVRHKLKCDRSMPCGSCNSANTPQSCSYPAEKPPNNHVFSSMPSPNNHAAPYLDAGPHAHREDVKPRLQQGHVSGSMGFECYNFDPSQAREFARMSQPVDPLLLHTEGYSPLFDEGSTPGTEHSNSFMSEAFSASAQMDFRAGGFNWLDFDLPNIDLVIHDDAALEGTMTAPGPPAPSAPLPHHDMSSHQQTNYPGPIVLPWPFEQGQDVRPSRFPLPRLQEVLPKTVRSRSDSTQLTPTESLLQVLSETHVPSTHDAANNNFLPGINLLRQLIDVYFTDFQTIQPIMHVPTWRMEDCPMMLLAAMACIGAVLSKDSNIVELSESISEVCSSTLTLLGISDSTNYSNISYLAALCLHQIYSLGSGNRQLYQNADRTRGVLIGSLRGLGLLSSRLDLRVDTGETTGSASNAVALQAEWITWATRERENRVVWASFEYDCSLCTLTSRRGAVDLSELPPRLPCAEPLYEAPNPQVWAALKSRLPSEAQGPYLADVLGSATARRPLSEHISSWSKRLSTQVIGRLLWDLKQLETLSTPGFFDLSSLFKAHQQSKSSLLRGLDCILESMDRPSSTCDLVSYNISSLLCHYSHMYASDDIMDMILYIVRTVVSRGPSSDKSLEATRHRLTSAMKSNAVRARRLLWRAGQIVAVANEYLVSAPCEIMRLFMAYVFILAYAKYCPQEDQPNVVQPVRLDIPSRQVEHRKVVFEWITNGGPAQIGSAERVYFKCSTAAITRDAQCMFQRLRSWGLSERFAKILQYFEENDG